MVNQREQLGAVTVIVADTGEIESIKKYKPEDATTNPSLLLQAASKEEYAKLVDDAVEFGLKQKDGDVVTHVMDKLAVNFGTEITKIVPGVVSTEVDARLSFDTQATIDKARRLIALYKENGVDKSRILIKIASTWEGIRAAQELEKEGISCNMTLLFSMAQAVACAEANATLISPFVGRITDWYKASTGTENYGPEDDPGVKSVRAIYKYYKNFGYKTVVMGASFRNIGQILALAGCDKLTIAPKFLKVLAESEDDVPTHLKAEEKSEDIEKLSFDEAGFRWALNEDAMATEKLAEGIRRFAADSVKLENIIKKKIEEFKAKQ